MMMVALDIRRCFQYLGEITGEFSNEGYAGLYFFEVLYCEIEITNRNDPVVWLFFECLNWIRFPTLTIFESAFVRLLFID